MSTFDCETCFDTGLIDQGGREVYCPECKPVIQFKLTGLQHGLGLLGNHGYETVTNCTPTTMTFTGYKGDILRDVQRQRSHAVGQARAEGHTGRTSMSSGQIAIEKRVKEALK